MLGSDRNVSSVLVLAVMVALPYGKETLPIDVLTACLDQIIRFAIIIYLQKHSLELDRICYAWFGPKRKFRPRSGCVGSTTVRQGNPPD